MVREQYDDLEFSSAGFEVSAWRCLNCGSVVDPVIASHRRNTHNTEPIPFSWQRLFAVHSGTA